jgi:hypothetical protein
MDSHASEEARLVQRVEDAYLTARREVFDLEGHTRLTQRQTEVLTALESAEMDLHAHRDVTSTNQDFRP